MIVASRRTGLRPIVIDSGTHVSAPIPQQRQGMEERRSSRSGLILYTLVSKPFELGLNEITPLENIRFLVLITEDLFPVLGSSQPL
jgi:hypothetical protein